MINYALRDGEGNELALNDITIPQPARSSLTLGNDIFTFENELIDNSALPGSTKLGKTRVESRQVSIRFSRSLGSDKSGEENSDAFRLAENQLIQFLFKAIELRDNTNLLKVPITLQDYNISYDDGGHKISADVELSLQFLNPFWEKITPKNYNLSLPIGTTLLEVTNGGYFVVPPYITLTALSPVTELQIYIDETKEGIQLNENIFGQTGFESLVIDCINGLVFIGDLDRTISILPGTGFFTIPVGSSSLIIITNEVFTFDMDFYERYFI